jgi:hypothetical protein
MKNIKKSEALIDKIYQLILKLEKLEERNYEGEYSFMGDIHDKTKFSAYRNFERIRRYFPFIDDGFDYTRAVVKPNTKEPVTSKHGSSVLSLLEFRFKDFDFDSIVRRLIRADQINQVLTHTIVDDERTNRHLCPTVTNRYLPLNEWLFEFISHNTEQLKEFILTISKSVPEVALRCVNTTNTLDLLQNNVNSIVLICYYVSPYKKITIEDVAAAIEEIRK